jgi:hypothetical protein
MRSYRGNPRGALFSPTCWQEPIREAGKPEEVFAPVISLNRTMICVAIRMANEAIGLQAGSSPEYRTAMQAFEELEGRCQYQ